MNEFTGLSPREAAAFAEPWLAAWSAADAQHLSSFYAEDACYCDAVVPDGVVGTAALRDHFGLLLGTYPGWVWRQRRSTPLAGGFLNYWHASVPFGPDTVEIDGVCTVYLRGDLIERNEVFFDPTPLVRPPRRRS